MGRSAGPLAGLDGPELLRAWEAASRVAPVRRAAAVLDAVLEDLPFTAELLPVGSCDTLMLALRIGTFGGWLSGVTSCPSCGAEADLDVDVAAILARLPAVDPADSEADPVQHGDHVVWYRLPTTADLVACADHPDAAMRVMARCITGATLAGEDADPADLPADVLAAVADAMAAGDQAADLRLRTECPACGDEHAARLDIAGFFVNEITAAALTLLAEVDELASRYGWSEPEILALSPTRRRTYLELR
jgi:hypothetical protein